MIFSMDDKKQPVLTHICKTNWKFSSCKTYFEKREIVCKGRNQERYLYKEI